MSRDFIFLRGESMENQVTNYKCPACTGPIHFDSSSGKMVCDYCDSVFEVSEIEELYKDENAAAAAATAQAGEQPEDEWSFDNELIDEASGVKAYNCPSCGAQLICDETTAATSCPYCGNPTIIPASLSGALKPELIIPFKLDKEAAKKALREHFRGKKLLPALFAEENRLEEIKGVYVPFWFFDAEARAEAEFSGTKVRTWSDRDYNYTETRFYALERCGRANFDNIPVDASEKMSDELMQSLEPFDYSQAVEFKTSYLSGYFADRYDVPAENCAETANTRVRESSMELLRSTTGGYLSVTQRSGRVRVSNGKAKYALLPVWLLNTTWNGEKFLFAMNGQNGKFIGDLPVDKKTAWKYRLLYGGGIALLLTAAEFLLKIF